MCAACVLDTRNPKHGSVTLISAMISALAAIPSLSSAPPSSYSLFPICFSTTTHGAVNVDVERILSSAYSRRDRLSGARCWAQSDKETSPLPLADVLTSVEWLEVHRDPNEAAPPGEPRWLSCWTRTARRFQLHVDSLKSEGNVSVGDGAELAETSRRTHGTLAPFGPSGEDTDSDLEKRCLVFNSVNKSVSMLTAPHRV